jgi:hypothetical protein
VASGEKILIVGPDVAQAVQDVKTYVASGMTVVPETAREEDLDAFMARGRVPGCTCGQITCVCALLHGHADTCRYRRSVACPVSIHCEHGVDVCPVCDACDCGGSTAPEV